MDPGLVGTVDSGAAGRGDLLWGLAEFRKVDFAFLRGRADLGDSNCCSLGRTVLRGLNNCGVALGSTIVLTGWGRARSWAHGDKRLKASRTTTKNFCEIAKTKVMRNSVVGIGNCGSDFV